jgi:dephospho-CoA kinase
VTSKRNNSLKIGITGNICTGKTLVRTILQRYGVSTFDPEEAVLQMLAENPQQFSIRLSEHFGPDMLDSRGRLSKKKLMHILHLMPEKKAFFEDKLNPVIREEAKRFLYSSMGPLIRAVESTTLLENDTSHLYDEVWVVTAEPKQQMQRLAEREHLSVGEINYLLNSQWPQEKKVALSHRVIDNSNSIHQTENQVRKILDELNLQILKIGL